LGLLLSSVLHEERLMRHILVAGLRIGIVVFLAAQKIFRSNRRSGLLK
jgi:hypothetical protein